MVAATYILHPKIRYCLIPFRLRWKAVQKQLPILSFFLSCGKRKHLLDKLLNERIDILILSDECPKQLEPEYASTLIPCEEQEQYITSLGLPAENTDKEKWIRVVWKKSLKSQNRDRVIAALEMEHYRLKCGYADYLG